MTNVSLFPEPSGTAEGIELVASNVMQPAIHGSIATIVADADLSTKLVPADAAWYDALAAKDTLVILWEFLRQDPGYQAAYDSWSRASSISAVETTRLANSFGLRKMLPPDISPLPEYRAAFPLLAILSTEGTTLGLGFDYTQDPAAQVKVAFWLLQRRRFYKEGGTCYPRRTRRYTNHRLAFLLRVLHCSLCGLPPSKAAALLADMRLGSDDEKQTGRKRKSKNYTAKNYTADLIAAKAIRAEKLLELMHEARISRYVDPDKPWPL